MSFMIVPLNFSDFAFQMMVGDPGGLHIKGKSWTWVDDWQNLMLHGINGQCKDMR